MNGNWGLAPCFNPSFFRISFSKISFYRKKRKHLPVWILRTWLLFTWLLCTCFFSILASGTSFAVETVTETKEELTSPEGLSIEKLEPNISREEVVEPKIDQENFEISMFVGAISVEDFGVNSIYGLRAAYHLTEDFFIEATLLTQSDTDRNSVEIVNNINLIEDENREYAYRSLELGWNIMPGESFLTQHWTLTSQFYLIGGGGITDFAGGSASTLNLGAGYRILLNDTFALRLDFRDHIFEIDLFGNKKRTHNFETNMGISIFF